LVFLLVAGTSDPSLAQKGAVGEKKGGIKTIPMGYLLISTSSTPTTVEIVAQPDPITEADVEKAVAYAR